MVKFAQIPKYEAYKDSGVEWLGDIPAEWSLIRLKNTMESCVNGLWGDDPKGKDEIVVLRVADFDYEKLSILDYKLTYRAIPEKDRQSRLLKNGDLLIEKSGGGDKTLVGRVVAFNKEYQALTSNFVAKISPQTWVDSSFLKYVFATLYSNNINYLSIKQTTGIQNLDTSSYFNEFFCFPIKSEQALIANYLDQKTAQIDAAIAIKEQQIELLKERKQIIIQQAVTQGLDPNVPMKDSGVEWIGQIPEHWEVKRLKYIFNKIQTGTTPTTSNQRYFDGEISWFTPKDLNNSYLTSSEKTVSELALRDKEVKIFPGNSVLIVGIGATSGKTAYMERPSTFNQQITGLYSTENNAEFLYYLISIFSDLMLSVANYTTLPILNNEFFKEFILPHAPLNEQEEILGYLIKKSERIEELIKLEKQQIQKLTEYKTTLINSAVTGKIKITPEMLQA